MADSRGQGGPAGVYHLRKSRKGLASLREASGGPQAAGLAVGWSEDTVSSGLAATQSVEAAKAPMADSCQVIEGRVAVRGLTELLECMAVENRFFLRVSLVDDSCWLFLVLPPSWLGHKCLALSLLICIEPGPRGQALQ